MNTNVRTLFLIASILALVASVAVFFLVGSTLVTESTQIEASQEELNQQNQAGETMSGVHTERQLSWFESQGWWGVAILFIFSALYYGPLHFYQVGKLGRAALFGITAVTLTMLAMFSIGFFFVLSGLCVLLGLILMGIDIFIKRNSAP